MTAIRKVQCFPLNEQHEQAGSLHTMNEVFWVKSLCWSHLSVFFSTMKHLPFFLLTKAVVSPSRPLPEHCFWNIINQIQAFIVVKKYLGIHFI